MKIEQKIILMIAILLILVPSAKAIEVTFRMSGGISLFNPAIINQSLKSWENYNIELAENMTNWSFSGGEVSEFSSTFDFEGEIMVAFSRYIAVGVSAGYIYGEITEEQTELAIEKVLGTFLYNKPTKISASPLVFSGYFFLPFKKRFHLYLRGGGGPMWCKYIDMNGTRSPAAETFSYPQTQIASTRGSSLVGGLGFMVDFEQNFRIFIEGTFKRAKISGFYGENKQEEEGTLYSFEEYIQELDLWYLQHKILAGRPEGDNYRFIEETEVDLSGFSFKIGLAVKF